MERVDFLVQDLPQPDEATRFLGRLAETHPAPAAKLLKKESLLSDVVTLVSFSPLLATTLIQNPDYLWWLDRKRLESGGRGKDELLESLARFSMTNSGLEHQVLFARFRRRELLRIYLRDIRRLATISEITEEISSLADAILEAALKLAIREMDNRFGSPQETDARGRERPATFCVAALGKLGSRELNYSSDIDLVFIYSGEGETTGSGSRGRVTNREYFVKLAEYLVKLVGQQVGEGAAYRVDLRLRPHGSLGALALSVSDMSRYYHDEARPWERQVMIRSRGCAGNIKLFSTFFSKIEDLVFSTNETADSALQNVRLSKEKIDREQSHGRGFDVKLGRGGIREIEFLAQALQLAHGGNDEWLRSPHTLISLVRLADRGHLSASDLTELSAAYAFLRRTEHVLQMENGVQTHTIPNDPAKREMLSRRVMFAAGGDFESELSTHTGNVARIFSHVFTRVADAGSSDSGQTADQPASSDDGQHDKDGGELAKSPSNIPTATDRAFSHVMASIDKSDVRSAMTPASIAVLKRITSTSPRFSAILAANPDLAVRLTDPDAEFDPPDYAGEMMAAVEQERDFGRRLAAMRRTFSAFLLEIVVRDIFEKLTISETRALQTELAEASIAAALRVVRDELSHRFSTPLASLDLAVLALGKLGGRGLDYDSDLDLVIVYFDPQHQVSGLAPAEFYSRAVELFSTALSSMTRDGNLYRVDLRLRPFGSKGMSTISIDAFLEYMARTAAVWELLAFVKLRHVGGDPSLGRNVESEARRLIHERAWNVPAGELRSETVRVRLALEQERASKLRGREVDIKYGEGGMLDVFFAVRYLQLRDNVPDNSITGAAAGADASPAGLENAAACSDRSTAAMLDRLAANGSLGAQDHRAFRDGYQFLTTLDHNLRLTVGRTTRVPLANTHALTTIARRMSHASPNDLLESLTIHRLTIRAAFDRILSVHN